MKRKTFIALSIALLSLGKQNVDAQTATNVFNTTGYAGIGITSPASPLQIENTVGGNCSSGFYGVQSALRIDDVGYVTSSALFTSTHNVFEVNHSVIGCSSSIPATPIFFINTTDRGGSPSYSAVVGINKSTATHTLDVGGTINADGNLSAGGNATVTGATALASTLGVTGATTLSSTLGVTGNTALGGTLGVAGATTLSSTLGVTGNTTISAPVNITGGSSTLAVAGATTLSSTLNVGGVTTMGTNTYSIGTPSGYSLYVAQGILTERLKVANHTDGTNWSDFVFNKNYKLMSLSELEKYYSKNKHLPEIPSAKEIGNDGIDVADMDAKLLQKIEELTLYIVKQQKEIDELNKEIKQ